ncbi:MAG: hypothetical protein K8R11_01470 [Methanococcoides sp.]|nr:hypothetical protein [Methanococcoides sp.]
MEQILNIFIKHRELLAGLFIGLLGFNVYSYYCREKDLLIQDIERLVEDCRRLSSFDDRSEYKLNSWLELGSGELHRKSLFSLKKIKNEMVRYFNIHIEMDLEQ